MNAEFTVRELARYPGLDITVAVGGTALDRPVRWAHSTELLDPRAYLYGGELVLTVGSGLTGPERCAAFVHALSECQVAALGLGTGDVHDQPPEALVTACESTGLPLLLIPPSTPFIEITELLAEHRIRLASDRSRRAMMGRLIEAVLHRQATPDVLAQDVAKAGLDPHHLVASLWPLALDDTVCRRFQAAGCLSGELPEAMVVISGEIDEVDQAATALGVACRRSEEFSLEDLAPSVQGVLDAWNQVGEDQSPDDSGMHAHARGRSHYTYLVNSVPQESLEPMLQDLIEPLLEKDDTSGAHLVESLSEFLQHDGSVQAAARTMHLHPNSLRNRLNRIYELTGRNPLLFRDQVDFAIALEALQRRSHTHPQ